MKKFLVFLPFCVFILLSGVFFKDFFVYGKLPIPSDTIIGLYHPFRDLYANDYPRGVPFKNSLITDPVRQQYPWRLLGVDQMKNLKLPLWNPYEMAGTPLLGNIQNAAFYPFNALLFLLPFQLGWSFLIVFQVILGGLFLYFYLRKQKLDILPSLFGAISYSLSGFSIAWLEWGTIGQVALWLPLILLSVDEIFNNSKSRNKRGIVWFLVLTLSFITAFFAGHLQTFFYLYLVSLTYFIIRWFQNKRPIKVLLFFLVSTIIFIIITSIQWIPAIQLISESARAIDQSNNWEKEGWFIPFVHVIQFIAPDFFGNPTTLNYWGTWNYGELVGYIGILPLLFAVYGIFIKKNSTLWFFIAVFVISFIFAFPTGISSLIYKFSIPFFSSAQPTRLLFLIDFSLCVLSAFGFTAFLKNPHKKFFLVPGLFFLLFGFLWTGVLFKLFPMPADFLLTAKRNLIFPSLFFTFSIIGLFMLFLFRGNKKAFFSIAAILVVCSTLDLFRFGWKFTPFTSSSYLFPTTKLISFLQKQEKPFRIMTTSSEILPPNFSVAYKIESIDGYDPLYLLSYGQLIVASERGEPNISPPFGFNRIITPQKYNSKIINMLGVKYVLTFTDITSVGYKKVFQEGKTKIFENSNATPRIVFVSNVETAESRQDAINQIFLASFDSKQTAVVEDSNGEISRKSYEVGTIVSSVFEENKITIQTENKDKGFLVLFDTFYKSWHATIDGNNVPIYRTNFNFRGIEVPAGIHKIIFSPYLF